MEVTATPVMGVTDTGGRTRTGTDTVADTSDTMANGTVTDFRVVAYGAKH
jgi:hypothetical protein